MISLKIKNYIYGLSQIDLLILWINYVRGIIYRFYTCSVYLCGNDNRLNAIKDVHDKKLYNLNNDIPIYHHDIDKIIHNLS